MKKLMVAAIVTALGACNAPAPQPPPMPADVAPFIARQRVHANEEEMALARGQLVIVDGCVRLTSPVGNPGRLVIWPVETTVDASTGAVRVRNTANGSDVGLGENIEMGGGEADGLQPGSLAEPIPPACTGPYWIAGSRWRALPSP